jgi:RecB family exonuclease
MDLVQRKTAVPAGTQAGHSPLSPSQVRLFLACSAKWWFKYGLGLPEPKTSSLALGLAVHRTLEMNFREKLETREDLETGGMVAVFRDVWREESIGTKFREDENPHVLRKIGEELVAKYMDEAAPSIDPAAVELDVSGEIGGVRVRGRIDLMDTEGRIVDVKTAARRPSGISPDYAFQLATYRTLTPGASGEPGWKFS